MKITASDGRWAVIFVCQFDKTKWRLRISQARIHKHSNMVMVCPITHTDRQHPFHIKLEGAKKVDGYVLCEQAKMMDITARKARYIEDAPLNITNEINQLVRQFL